MRLLLHIGTEKTGTKSLQTWFAQNREPLRQQGVHYPTSLGDRVHRSLALFAMDPNQPDERFVQEGIQSAVDHQAFCERTFNSFTRECDAFAAIPTWILSCEQLHSRLATQEMVERVKSFLCDRFESIKVIVHLRPQVDLAVSLASTGARGGTRINAAWFAPDPEQEYYFNYNLSVGWWENVFGENAVTIVPFKRKPNLVKMLIDELSIEDSSMTPVERKNEALDWRSIALSNALALYNPSRDFNEVFIDDWPFRERLEIGLELAQRFQS
ncbi:MAG: hypothetical protein JSS00_07995, partial [Proteobacteria bacterium]|nr:hypothetical protein [Pseudomonadota bacterium]